MVLVWLEAKQILVRRRNSTTQSQREHGRIPLSWTRHATELERVRGRNLIQPADGLQVPLVWKRAIRDDERRSPWLKGGIDGPEHGERSGEVHVLAVVKRWVDKG